MKPHIMFYNQKWHVTWHTLTSNGEAIVIHETKGYWRMKNAWRSYLLMSVN